MAYTGITETARYSDKLTTGSEAARDPISENALRSILLPV